MTCGHAGTRRGGSSDALDSGDVLAADGKLFWCLDTHFHASPGTAEQSDLDGAVGEQLRHGHVGVYAIGRLYDNRLIGSSAQD